MDDHTEGRRTRDGVSRRQLLGRAGTAAAGSVAAAGLVGTLGADPASAATAATELRPRAFGPVTIKPGDVRYDSMLRGDNFRFAGDPDQVVVVPSSDENIKVTTARDLRTAELLLQRRASSAGDPA